METPFGRMLWGRTMIQNIGNALYKDRDNIESSIKKQYPPWANVASKDFSYGFTVRDKSAPEDWKNPARLTELPPAQVLEVQPLDRVKDFFSVQNLSTLFTTDPAAAAASSSQPKSSS